MDEVKEETVQQPVIIKRFVLEQDENGSIYVANSFKPYEIVGLFSVIKNNILEDDRQLVLEKRHNNPTQPVA